MAPISCLFCLLAFVLKPNSSASSSPDIPSHSPPPSSALTRCSLSLAAAQNTASPWRSHPSPPPSCTLLQQEAISSWVKSSGIPCQYFIWVSQDCPLVPSLYKSSSLVATRAAFSCRHAHSGAVGCFMILPASLWF